MTTARDFCKYAPKLQKPKAAGLPPEEERRLADLMRAGDAAAHQRLWEVALPLVPYCAAALRRAGFMLHVPWDDPDMLQEGYLCIGPTLLRWDPALGRMSSFLVPRIRGALLDWAAEAYKGGIASKHTDCHVVGMDETILEGEFETLDHPGLHAQAAGYSRLELLTYDGIYGPGGLEESSANPNAGSAALEAAVDDLNRLLYTLPDELADIVRLAYGIGCAQLSAQEIADMTGQSARSVYRKTAQGVAELKQKWRDCKYGGDKEGEPEHAHVPASEAAPKGRRIGS